MIVRALFVFCCAILIQVLLAAPPTQVRVPFEVSEAAGNVGIENALTQNASDGDVMLKTPEPLSMSVPSISTSGSGVSVSTGMNDSVDQVVGDHTLPSTPAMQILNGNGSPSSATSSTPSTAFAVATSVPATPSTTEIKTSPFDNEISVTSGPTATAGLTGVDPLFFYKLFTSILRNQQQFMPMNLPFPGIASAGFPAMRIPPIRLPNPNDPSLKLVDQQVINDGDLTGEIKTYEGRPDPNTIAKKQTSQFSVNKDGLQGAGNGYYYSSASSSSSGSNPMASVGTYFSGMPSRINMNFPFRLT